MLLEICLLISEPSDALGLFLDSYRLLLLWAPVPLEGRMYLPWQMRASLCGNKEPSSWEDLLWSVKSLLNRIPVR